MTVLNFRGHHWVRCRQPKCNGCMYCRGGLACCDRCGGAEGDLPTHCPGRRMNAAERIRISEGRLDYDERRGGWIDRDRRRSRLS